MFEKTLFRVSSNTLKRWSASNARSTSASMVLKPLMWIRRQWIEEKLYARYQRMEEEDDSTEASSSSTVHVCVGSDENEAAGVFPGKVDQFPLRP